MLAKLKKRKRIRTHGFRSRTTLALNKRRSKGRKSLATTIHSK